MKPRNLYELSVAELLERFTIASLGQYQAEFESNIAKQNKFVRQTMAIADELKSRPGDQRVALTKLYDHPNVQVRLNAAKLTLAVAPTAAREVIQTIKDSKEYPQAMDAGMCLWTIEQGIFTPT
jgi:hypothetical protein